MESKGLGSKINTIRKENGFSQEELAIKAGIDLRTIQRIENGETKPRGYTLRQIAIALNIQPGKLLFGSLRENRSLLQAMNLLVLGSVFTPAFGTMVLVVMWLNLRKRIKGADELGKLAINYHITIFFMGSFLVVLYAFFFIQHSVEGQMIIGFLVLALLLLTLVLVAINSYLIAKRKQIIYKPAFEFIK